VDPQSVRKGIILRSIVFSLLSIIDITLIFTAGFLIFGLIISFQLDIAVLIGILILILLISFIFLTKFLLIKRKRIFKRTAITLSSLIIFSIFGFFYLFQPARIVGASVGSGKYQEGQIVLGEKVTYLFRDPKIGDIVTFISLDGRRMGQIHDIQREDAAVVYLVKHDADEDSKLTKDRINSRIYFDLPFKKQNDLSKKVQELTENQIEDQTVEDDPAAEENIHISKRKIIDGSIKWNPNVEEISSSGKLSLMNLVVDLMISKANGAVLNGIKYYKVGTWQTGKYEGDDLIDVVVSHRVSGHTPSGFNTQNYEGIARVSVHDNNLIIFLSNSYSGVFFSLDYSFPDGLPDGLAVYERGKIPDLFYSYPVYYEDSSKNILFPVQYQGKTKQFIFWNDFQQESKFNTAVKTGYKFLTTFSRGQKIYIKTVALNPVKLSQIVGNPYYVEDLDHTMIHLYWSVSSSEMFSENITWIKQPDFLSDVVYKGREVSEVKSIRDMIFWGLTDVDLSNEESLYKLFQNSTFNLSEMELVATSDTHQIYRPTNADAITRYLYNNVVKFAPSLSYERFVNSFPILIYKDVFGTYELMFGPRSRL
jgi:hypothetical protein